MGKNLAKSKATFYFCDGGSCRKAGSEAALRTARAHLRNKGLWESTHTIKTRCNGRCEDAPTWIVQQGDYWYKNVSPQKAVRIVDSHCDLASPLASELLFERGQDHVKSDNERPTTARPVFTLSEDATLGEVYKVRGFHSDQYLYPLFQFLHESNTSAKIIRANGQVIRCSDLQEVDYSAPYHLQLKWGITEIQETSLVIALIPVTEAEALKKQRISVCEYLVQLSSGDKVIRLKDKVGQLVAEIHMDSEDSAIWEYCLRIQLNNATDPLIATK